MIAANQRQMELKAQRQAAVAAEEERLRQSMLDKFAEDDRIEQMNAQKRRMKMLEHRREVWSLIFCTTHKHFAFQPSSCTSTLRHQHLRVFMDRLMHRISCQFL